MLGAAGGSSICQRASVKLALDLGDPGASLDHPGRMKAAAAKAVARAAWRPRDYRALSLHPEHPPVALAQLQRVTHRLGHRQLTLRCRTRPTLHPYLPSEVRTT